MMKEGYYTDTQYVISILGPTGYIHVPETTFKSTTEAWERFDELSNAYKSKNGYKVKLFKREIKTETIFLAEND